MYVWRLNELKSELKGRGISEADAFRYVLASSVLGLLVLALATAVPPSNVWDYLGTLVVDLIIIAGTVCCYRMNGGSHGANFLPRYVSLSWVCVVRWLVLAGVPLVIVVAVVRIAGILGEATTWYDVLGYAAITAILFWRIGLHIADVAEGGKAA